MMPEYRGIVHGLYATVCARNVKLFMKSFFSGKGIGKALMSKVAQVSNIKALFDCKR